MIYNVLCQAGFKAASAIACENKSQAWAENARCIYASQKGFSPPSVEAMRSCSHGQTALHLLASSTHAAMLSRVVCETSSCPQFRHLLRGEAADCSPLAVAVASGNIDAAMTLLDHGAAPNYGQQGQTMHLVHDAACGGRRMLKALSTRSILRSSDVKVLKDSLSKLSCVHVPESMACH
jgi:hypothetical protein